MKAKGLINDKSVQVVIEADNSLEMGLLKRMVSGVNGNGHSLGAGYGNTSNNYGYGYDHISLVIYDNPDTRIADQKIIYTEIKGQKYVRLEDVLKILNPDNDTKVNDLAKSGSGDDDD